jgi:hypothetical protein
MWRRGTGEDAIREHWVRAPWLWVAPTRNEIGVNTKNIMGWATKTTEQFVVSARAFHGDLYVYDKVVYINNNTPVIITCTTHGDFLQRPNKHTTQTGCPKCAVEKSALTTAEFVSRSMLIHGNRYCYTESVYSGFNRKLTVLCQIHGAFAITPSKHFDGGGCPRCNLTVSKSEEDWLNALGVVGMVRQHRITINGKVYKVDGFDPSTNTVYEFWGDYWHGNPAKFHPSDIHPSTKKTYGEMYQDTINKIQELESVGYQVIDIWEADYNHNMRSCSSHKI